MSGSRSYQRPYKGSQIDEAVKTIFGGTLADKNFIKIKNAGGK